MPDVPLAVNLKLIELLQGYLKNFYRQSKTIGFGDQTIDVVAHHKIVDCWVVAAVLAAVALAVDDGLGCVLLLVAMAAY